MKHKIHLVNILLFLTFIAGLSAFTLFSKNSETVLEQENRTKAEFPSFSTQAVFSGNFFPFFEDWFSDRIYKRESWVLLNRKLETYRGLSLADSVEIISRDTGDLFAGDELTSTLTTTTTTTSSTASSPVSFVETSESPEEESTLIVSDNILLTEEQVLDDITDEVEVNESSVSEEIDAPAAPQEAEVIETVDNVTDFLVLNNRAYEIVSYNPASIEYYAGKINDFTDLAGEGITIYSAVAPSSINFLEDQRYCELSTDQTAGLAHLKEVLRPQILFLDVEKALQPHSKDYLYFHTDHHWTALGGYYTYRSFCGLAGFDPLSLDLFERDSIDGFTGTLYDLTLSTSLLEHPDRVEIYKPPVETEFTVFNGTTSYLSSMYNYTKAEENKNKYLVFIGGDDPLSVITTSADSDRTILVFKDSYANAFIPFLASHYKEIHVIDPRYFDGNAISYLHEHQIKEVLFFNYFVVVSLYNGFARNIGRVTHFE